MLKLIRKYLELQKKLTKNIGKNLKTTNYNK